MSSNFVWTATLDDHTWRADVVRSEQDHEGILTVTRVADDTEILRETVDLSFNARFGPDVDDVNMWCAMAIEAVDKHNAEATS